MTLKESKGLLKGFDPKDPMTWLFDYYPVVFPDGRPNQLWVEDIEEAKRIVAAHEGKE